MATTVFKNISQLMTMKGAVKKQGRKPLEKDLSLIKNAALVVDGGEVLWVGSEKKLPANYKKAKKIDLKGASVLPGLIDCHTHTVFAGNRSHEFEMRNQGVSYQEIARRGGGILSTVKATRKASEKELLSLGQKRADRFVEQGITTLEIKSGYGLNRASELKMLKVAGQIKGPRILTTFLGAHAIPKPFKTESEYLSALEKMLPEIKRKNLSQRVDIFIEKGYFSLAKAKKFLELAQELGFEVTIHADQLSRTGATALAVSLGALSADHAIELTASDVSQLAKSDTTAVLLPAADFYIHAPYPKARKLIDSGARCALASDFNPGSSPNQNINFVGLLARLHMKMTLPEVFVGFTVAAAHALNMQNQIGALLPGWSADFIVTDQPWSQFFYDAAPVKPLAVWRQGRRIFKK